MADIPLGSVPVSILNDTDKIIFAEGTEAKQTPYSDMKTDMLGSAVLATTAPKSKEAINELVQDLLEATGYGVVSGGVVTAQSTPNMTVQATGCTLKTATGARQVVAANSALAVTTADTTNPRKDIVYVDSTGVIQYLQGTASATPVAPTTPTGGFLLSEIYVTANATTITNANITDRRKTLISTDWLNSQLSELTKQKKIRLDADSFGNTGGTDGKRFADRVAKSKKYLLTNSAVGGQTLYDVFAKIISEVNPPSQYDIHMINLGFNDVRKWGDITGINYDIALRIAYLINYLYLSNIKKNNDASITYNGTWQTASSIGWSILGNAKFTGTVNSSVTFGFTGDKLTIGTFTLTATGTNGTIEIKVDGVTVKTVTLGLWAGRGAYGPTTIQITGLSSGNHTCTITKIDNTTNNIYFDWFGTQLENTPTIIVNGLTKMKTSSYSIGTPDFNKANDTIINSTNAKIREYLATNFNEKVIFIDQNDFDANNYNVIDTDLVHPNDFGHSWLADNILKRI